MRESRLYGSVRGARGNSRPYREIVLCCGAVGRILAQNGHAVVTRRCPLLTHRVGLASSIDALRTRFSPHRPTQWRKFRKHTSIVGLAAEADIVRFRYLDHLVGAAKPAEGECRVPNEPRIVVNQ